MSSDLTFITNEPGKQLRDRFGALREVILSSWLVQPKKGAHQN
ncbi:MAG: hypothetical protein NTZ09_13960 [Candidatus Hydrogenedentes bacterium]|nr:hypothetical protein [Candidatus Hydrogenedentota bacterium]